MSNKSVLQDWVSRLSLMQQTVLITGVRGPDGIPKYGTVKMLLRWYRRCVLISAFDGIVLINPYDKKGGSFTGPSMEYANTLWEDDMGAHISEYLRLCDSLPFHFQTHFMHASEILGYKHPDKRIREWWANVYQRIVKAIHLHPETETELDHRLGDSRQGWLDSADEATID